MYHYNAKTFRNPDKHESSRAMAVEQHDVFVKMVDSHVVPGNGVETIRAYRTFMGTLNPVLQADSLASPTVLPRDGDQVLCRRLGRPRSA